MDKYVRATLLVVAIIVLAALLFNFGIQLYWMFAGATGGAFGPMVGPMMRGAGGVHAFGGSPFGFFGPIFGIALAGLLVAGIVALARGGRSGPTEHAESRQPKS
jgi:hypothetical protein